MLLEDDEQYIEAQTPERPRIDHEKLKVTLKKASKGVVVARTLQEYQRWRSNFKNFCVRIKIVAKPEDIEIMLHT